MKTPFNNQIKMVRVELPKWVHDELAKVPGGKKPAVERIVIEWAKRKVKKGE